MLMLFWWALLITSDAVICGAEENNIRLSYARSPEESLPKVDSSEQGVTAGNRSTNCICGWANKVKGRIIGGKEYAPHEYPFMAGVSYYHNPYRPFCGGVIISPRLVLTAAHCTVGASSLFVTVGEHDRSDDDLPTVYEVKKIINHEKFHPIHYHNDISLLILKNPIEFSTIVGPICLPLSTDSGQSLVGQKVRIIGWGSTRNNRKPLTVLPTMTILPKKADVKVIDLVSCNRAWPNSVYIRPARQLCTLTKGTAPCPGDDGGPVINVDRDTNRYTLRGLVSYGPPCGDEKPSLQTDITAYFSWININIMDYAPEEVICKKKL